MSSERKVTFDVPSVDYVHLINSFHTEVDALLVAYDTVMNNYQNNERGRVIELYRCENWSSRKGGLECYNDMYDMNIKTFSEEKQRLKDSWKKFRHVNYNRLCYLLDNVEAKYCETDPMFKGMSKRFPWLKMVEDLKSQPLDYFKTIKKLSKKLERKFYNTVQ
jgi:hypothetical protein